MNPSNHSETNIPFVRRSRLLEHPHQNSPKNGTVPEPENTKHNRVDFWILALGGGVSKSESAYKKIQIIEAMADFEMAPSRRVAAEAIPAGADWSPMLAHAKIGLLVDQSCTRLHRAYAGDAWTSRDDLKAGRYRQFVESWDQVAGIHKAARRVEYGGRYIEAVLEQPRYTAVVCRDSASLAVAELLASLMGLPVFQF